MLKYISTYQSVSDAMKKDQRIINTYYYVLLCNNKLSWKQEVKLPFPKSIVDYSWCHEYGKNSSLKQQNIPNHTRETLAQIFTCSNQNWNYDSVKMCAHIKF